MAIEMIGVLIFAWLVGLSQFLAANAVLIFVCFASLLLWLNGIITIIRRWERQ